MAGEEWLVRRGRSAWWSRLAQPDACPAPPPPPHTHTVPALLPLVRASSLWEDCSQGILWNHSQVFSQQAVQPLLEGKSSPRSAISGSQGGGLLQPPSSAWKELWLLLPSCGLQGKFLLVSWWEKSDQPLGPCHQLALGDMRDKASSHPSGEVRRVLTSP